MIMSDSNRLVIVSIIVGLVSYVAVTLTVCEEGNQIESALFIGIEGCQGSFYPVGPYTTSAANSKTECAMKCLSNPVCLSINAVDNLGDVDGVFCLFFDSATDACTDLVPDRAWTYLRLTNYRGTKRSTHQETSECSFIWQMYYSVKDNEQHGDEQLLHDLLQQGLSVRVLLLLPTDGMFHQLTPNGYWIEHADKANEIDTIYFTFPPRYYLKQTTDGYITFKEYIGVSTKGVISVRTYSTDNSIVSEESDSLSAHFFVKNVLDGRSPLYSVDGSGSGGSSQNLVSEFNKGSAFTILQKYGTHTVVMPDSRWSRLDKSKDVLGVIKYEGASYSTVTPTFNQKPLRRLYRIVVSSGVVKEIERFSRTSLTRETEIVEITQIWYADPCWKIEFLFSQSGGEHADYNTDNLRDKINRGHRIRVQYSDGNTLTTKTVRHTSCVATACQAYFDDAPELVERTFDFNWNDSSYSKPTVSELSVNMLSSYNTETQTASNLHLGLVTWFAHSTAPRAIFAMNRNGVLIELDKPSVVTGAPLQLVIAFQYKNVSLEVEEVVETFSQGGFEYDLHTAAVGIRQPLENCKGIEATRSRYTLRPSIMALSLNGWSVDWHTQCLVFETVSFESVTLFTTYPGIVDDDDG